MSSCPLLGFLLYLKTSTPTRKGIHLGTGLVLHRARCGQSNPHRSALHSIRPRLHQSRVNFVPIRADLEAAPRSGRTISISAQRDPISHRFNSISTPRRSLLPSTPGRAHCVIAPYYGTNPRKAILFGTGLARHRAEPSQYRSDQDRYCTHNL